MEKYLEILVVDETVEGDTRFRNIHSMGFHMRKLYLEELPVNSNI